MNFKQLLGGAATLLAVIIVVSAIPDVKRYIRISTM